jgi:hypothetical protein
LEAIGRTNVLAKVVVGDRAIQDSMASLVIDGVFERHPHLRAMSIENGAAWVTPLLRLMEKYANQAPEGFSGDPIEAFTEHVWVAPYCEDDIVELIDQVCDDLPELVFVMRHGTEPWVDLAVKLLLKWPNLYYSTTAFAPTHYPQEIIDLANTRGGEKIIYGGYYPFGIELERTVAELDDLVLKDEVWPKFLRNNAAKILGLPTT